MQLQDVMLAGDNVQESHKPWIYIKIINLKLRRISVDGRQKLVASFITARRVIEMIAAKLNNTLQ